MENLIAVDQIGRQFVGDIYYAVYDAAYKWYYQSNMGIHEGVLFKSWDTAESVSSKGMPPVSTFAHYIPRLTIGSVHPLLRQHACQDAARRLSPTA